MVKRAVVVASFLAAACNAPPDGDMTPPMVCSVVEKEAETRTIQANVGARFSGPEGTVFVMSIGECTIAPTSDFSEEPASIQAECAGWTATANGCRRSPGDAEESSGIFTARLTSNGPGTVSCHAELNAYDESGERLPASGDLVQSLTCDVP